MQHSRQASTGTGYGRGRGGGRGQAHHTPQTSGKQGSQGQQAQGQARVFALTEQEAATAPDVIRGNILLYDLTVCALIDPGAMHSFISTAIASRLPFIPGMLSNNLIVSTPVGKSVIVRTVYRDCTIQINMVEFPADLIVFPLLELDIILGMDWLSRYRAIVNCYTKEVVFDRPGMDKVVFYGE